MLLTPLCRALALAGCLLLALPAWSADATTNAKKEPPLPPSPPTADGAATDRAARALIDAGRFGDALALLGPRLQGERVEPNVLFLYGLASVEASQQPNVPDEVRDRLLGEAIGAFRIMLFNEPGLVRVRLELARAFFLKGEDDLSRRHFELVLAGDPPAQVVGNVRAFLNRMSARRRWSFNLGFALAPDNNIGASSEERTIYIFDLPFQRDQQELTTSGIGVSLWGGAEYQIPLGDTTRLRAGGQFARREYERSQFDQLYVAWPSSGRAGFWTGSTEVSLLASARQRWLGTVKDNHSLGARVEAAHRFSPAVTVAGQASWHERRYRTRTRLDGPVLDTSLTRNLGGCADGAGEPFRRLQAGAPALSPAVAPAQPLAGRWRRRDPASGLYGGRAAVNCGGPATRATGSRTPETVRRAKDRTRILQCICPQPGLHAVRLQPADRVGARGAGRATRSSTTTSAHAANFASCSSSDAAEDPGQGRTVVRPVGVEAGTL